MVDDRVGSQCSGQRPRFLGQGNRAVLAAAVEVEVVNWRGREGVRFGAGNPDRAGKKLPCSLAAFCR